jgi:poly(hydroxyalkanoate) granule-associated protein
MATKKATRKTTKKAATTAEIVKDSANKIWLAGLGAFALAEEEGGKMFHNLVTRGKDFEEAGREQLEKAREIVGDLAESAREKLGAATEDVRDRAGDTWQKVEKRWDERTARTLQKLGVPTRDEIVRLTRRIEELTSLVEKKAASRKPAARKRASGARTTRRRAS